MKIFDYQTLVSQKAEVIQAFHDKGIVGIRGVPGFVDAYENFIKSAQDFIRLPEEVRNQYTPQDAYQRGWSFGIETFNGVRDAFKGSYYVKYPEEHAESPNIWPDKDSPDFKKHYLALVQIIFRTGQDLNPLLNIQLKKVSSLTRMLYYGPIKDSSAVEWCGEHRDHGLLTGLCPGVYFYEGKRVSPPQGTGLFVRGEEVPVPDDVLLYQIGETAELITNGAVTATEHEVRKAVGGYERYSLALFMDPPFEYKIESTIDKYNDRYVPGMTYQEWNSRSFAKYNEMV